MTSDLPIVMLAAGASRRMRGRDKLLEEIDGETLLRRQLLRACEATSGRVIVTLPPAPHPRHAAIEGLRVTPVPVPDAATGMAASLRAGIAALPDAPAAMITLADMPEIDSTDMKRLLEAAANGGETLIWRGAATDGTPGHPLVFARTLWRALATVSGDRGGQDVVRAQKNKTRLIRLPGAHAITDLDTPEAWAAWRARRGGA